MSKRTQFYIVLIAGLYWYVRSRSKMKLTYFESSRNRKIAKFVFGNTKNRYSPTVWLVTGVLQTIMTTLLRIPKLKLVRENLHLKSMERKSTCAPRIIPEGLVSVDWIESTKSSQKDAVIVVVPGLTGSSQSGYIRRLAEHLVNNLNVRVAMYNPRGRGGKLTRYSFHVLCRIHC